MELDPLFAERDRCRKAGKPVEIARTKRLLIRETVLADVPELYRIWKQPGVGDYIDPMQPTLEEEMEFMEAYIRYAYAFYDFGLWTVLERKSGEVAGRAGLFPSKILADAVELGYMIAPDRQGRGYASECCREILQYASDVLDIHEVNVLADCRNRASLKIAEKLGFAESGKIWTGQAQWVHLVWKSRFS